MVYDKGPYPCHVGEFCGNVEVPHGDQEFFLANSGMAGTHYLGRPRPEHGKTTEELEKEHFRGIYVEISFAVGNPCCVLTPPALMEPGKEHLYNKSNYPGIG